MARRDLKRERGAIRWFRAAFDVARVALVTVRLFVAQCTLTISSRVRARLLHRFVCLHGGWGGERCEEHSHHVMTRSSVTSANGRVVNRRAFTASRTWAAIRKQLREPATVRGSTLTAGDWPGERDASAHRERVHAAVGSAQGPGGVDGGTAQTRGAERCPPVKTKRLSSPGAFKSAPSARCDAIHRRGHRSARNKKPQPIDGRSGTRRPGDEASSGGERESVRGNVCRCASLARCHGKHRPARRRG